MATVSRSGGLKMQDAGKMEDLWKEEPAGALMDLSSAAASKRIMTAVDSVSRKKKGGAFFNNLYEEGMARVMDPVLGPDDLGPPFTKPSGIGWDTSTECKNEADLRALAMKLNPVVGYWGAQPAMCLEIIQHRPS